MFVQQIGQTNLARLHWQTSTNHPIKEALCISPCNFVAIKTINLTKANRVLHGLNLAFDQVKAFIKTVAVGDFEIRRGFDKLNPLPSIHNSKLSTLRRHHRGQWCGLGHTTSRAMLVREMEPEFVLVILYRFQRGEFNICVPRKTTRIDTPCVIARFAVYDLLGQ